MKIFIDAPDDFRGGYLTYLDGNESLMMHSISIPVIVNDKNEIEIKLLKGSDYEMDTD